MAILDIMIMDQDIERNTTEVAIYFRLFNHNYSHTMWVSKTVFTLLNKLCK